MDGPWKDRNGTVLTGGEGASAGRRARGAAMLWSNGGGTDVEDAKRDVGVLKEDREKCYAARDAYYKCADAAGSGTPGWTSQVSPGQLIHKKCAKKRAEYEKLCKGSWVKHFDKLRDKHIRLEEITGPGR